MNEPTARTAIDAVADACAEVATTIAGGLLDRRDAGDGENPSGERRLAADTWADGLLADRLLDLECVGAYASEEREDPAHAGSGLSLAVDPLDGSSNVASNNPVGTIVGVYDAPLPAAGRDLVGALYVLYGPATTMVVASEGREGVVEHRVRDGGRERTREIEMPGAPTVFAFGGRDDDWTAAFREYVASVRGELKRRYGGAFVADVNRVLVHGGIFAYPALRSRPAGKLRLQFEAAPMSYLVERAGGRSTDGTRSILDVAATDLHQRVPVYLGSPELIDRLESTLTEPR
jgi:fructose-1,6-bisphosphatase I